MNKVNNRKISSENAYENIDADHGSVLKLGSNKFDPITEENFEEVLEKIESKTKKLNKWIQETSKELASLSGTPTTFDEILTIITLNRVKKVKEKLVWIKELQDSGAKLSKIKTSVQQKFKDRIYASTALQHECAIKLRKLEQASSKKICVAAWIFKHRVSEFMWEYRNLAQKTRGSLCKIIEFCQNVQSSGKWDNDDFSWNQWEIKRNYDVTMRLLRLGKFIGTIQTPACQECYADSQELKALFDGVSVRLKTLWAEVSKKRLEQEKSEGQQQKLKMIDDLHKKRCQEIYDWISLRVGNVTSWMNLSRKRSVGYKGIVGYLNNILDQLPEIKEKISEQLEGWSSYLSDEKYSHIKTVIGREKSLRGSLVYLEMKVKKEYQRCVLVLYAQTIWETVLRVYKVKDRDFKNICLLIVLYAYHTDKEEDIDDDEVILCVSEGNGSYTTRPSIQWAVSPQSQKSFLRVPTNTGSFASPRFPSLGSLEDHSNSMPSRKPNLNEKRDSRTFTFLNPEPEIEQPGQSLKPLMLARELAISPRVFGDKLSVEPERRPHDLLQIPIRSWPSSPSGSSVSVLNIGSDDDLADSEEQQMETHVKVLELRAVVAKLRFRVGELEVVEKMFHKDSLRVAQIEKDNRELLQENRRLREELSKFTTNEDTEDELVNNRKPILFGPGRRKHRQNGAKVS